MTDETDGCSSCEAIGNPEHADWLHNEIADLNLTISRLHRELKAARSCIAPAAPRPLAISAEEHAVGTFLRSMVAAGCELHLIDRTRLAVDEAVEHLLEAGRKHTGHTVCIRKDDDGTCLDINGWIGWP